MRSRMTLEDLNALSPEDLRALFAGPPAEVAALVRDLAEQGVVEAQLQLGQILLDGHGTPPAPTEALRWFATAAQGGSAMAANMVGRCYEKGWGTAIDLARAADWYRAAVDRGLDWGMYNLASLLTLGRGVAEDRPAAFALFQRAAALGHAKSVNMVGSYYEDGWVVAKDMAVAADHYARAAEGGDFRGQFNHARMLIYAGDHAGAAVWLRCVPETATAAFRDKARTWLANAPQGEVRALAALV